MSDVCIGYIRVSVHHRCAHSLQHVQAVHKRVSVCNSVTVCVCVGGLGLGYPNPNPNPLY